MNGKPEGQAAGLALRASIPANPINTPVTLDDELQTLRDKLAATTFHANGGMTRRIAAIEARIAEVEAVIAGRPESAPPQ
jgi:hypothetical protein